MHSLSEFCETAVARNAMGGNVGGLLAGFFAIVAGLKAAKREVDLSGVVANEVPLDPSWTRFIRPTMTSQHETAPAAPT